MDKFIDTDEARSRILKRIEPLGHERLTLTEASGRRLAEAILAPLDSPAFDNSAMDGFAFRWDDADAPLRVVGESAAGKPFDGEVANGEAIRIMTGAAVPAGVDTVAMREVCQASEDTVTVDLNEAKGAGANIRRRGSYMAKGEAVFEPGDVLGAAEIGLLASFGRTVVYVYRAPRVAIVTTGTELVEPDRTAGAGQIVNSNAFMLEQLVRQTGATATVLPIIPDEEDSTRRALQDAAAADLIITVGGVSVGDYDFVRAILDEMSAGIDFWKVRMKPGKPLAFGVLETSGTPVIGLPGNPVSSFVGFHQFVRPALAVQMGADSLAAQPQLTRVPTLHAIRSTPRRRQYVLGRTEMVDELNVFIPYPDQSSGNVYAIRGCTALALVPEGVDSVDEGAMIEVQQV